MFESVAYKGNKEQQYEMLLKQLTALIEDELDKLSNLSNTSALLNQLLEQINWVGFYLLKQDQLLLGPFQGLPACVRYDIGSGVCGSAFQYKSSIVIINVKTFRS